MSSAEFPWPSAGTPITMGANGKLSDQTAESLRKYLIGIKGALPTPIAGGITCLVVNGLDGALADKKVSYIFPPSDGRFDRAQVL